MFLKRIRVAVNGKRHTYWTLVKSIRAARGPRHSDLNRPPAYVFSVAVVDSEPGAQATGPRDDPALALGARITGA